MKTLEIERWCNDIQIGKRIFEAEAKNIITGEEKHFIMTNLEISRCVVIVDILCAPCHILFVPAFILAAICSFLCMASIPLRYASLSGSLEAAKVKSRSVRELASQGKPLEVEGLKQVDKISCFPSPRGTVLKHSVSMGKQF